VSALCAVLAAKHALAVGKAGRWAVQGLHAYGVLHNCADELLLQPQV
jgi:hypothetical protein